MMEGVDDLFFKGRLFTAFIVIALLAFATVKAFVGSTPPPISPALANGTYVSACCGSVTLHDGVMRYGTQTAHYTLSMAKTDLSANVDGDPVITIDHRIAILPGIQKSSFSFWRFPHRSNMTNSYDASREHPDRLSLWGQDYSGPYDFVLSKK